MPKTKATSARGCPVEAFQKMISGKYKLRIVWAAAGEDEADPCLFGGNADIHRQKHRSADADRRPVDRRDHRLQRFASPRGDAATTVAIVSALAVLRGAHLPSRLS
jgi:hypothetical protein